MDGAQVGVLKQSNEVGFAGLLKGSHGRALEPQVGLEVLSNLTNQTLKRQLADEQLGGFLVAPDFTESHGTGLVAVRLLDTSGGWCALTSGLGGQLLRALPPVDLRAVCLVRAIATMRERRRDLSR